ncbi:MAG TPA: sulfotransferase [Stellaceae bacterium]|jgi:hypothetical protein
MADTASEPVRRTGPVFVAGCPRSGTSALSWAIAAHPGYWTSAETHFFYYLLRNGAPGLRDAFDLSSGPGQWLDKHGVDYPAFLQHLGHGFDLMMRTHSGGLQWVDGSPENIAVGELLLQMYPSATMFVVVRDPRSVCFSMLTSGFSAPWASDIDAAVNEWAYYVRAGRSVAELYPGRAIEVRQEEMRSRPEAVAAVIADHLGLDEPSRVAAFLATRTVNSSADRASYAPTSPFREAPRSALTRAEFLARHEAGIMKETAELCRHYGYD